MTEISLLEANQIAENIIDFKTNVIKVEIGKKYSSLVERYRRISCNPGKITTRLRHTLRLGLIIHTSTHVINYVSTKCSHANLMKTTVQALKIWLTLPFESIKIDAARRFRCINLLLCRNTTASPTCDRYLIASSIGHPNELINSSKVPISPTSVILREYVHLVTHLAQI
jgi:hypothetical protein